MPEEDSQLPWCRATIAGGIVTLNRWAPTLIRGGPAAMALENLDGVVLADLYAPGDEEEGQEVLVRFVSRSPWPETAVHTLLAWARAVGYRRVWLPDRVVDLEPPDRALGLASVRCPTCGLEWRDESPEFWAIVHTHGAFPGFCAACGGSLPEWEILAGSGSVTATPVEVDRAGV